MKLLGKIINVEFGKIGYEFLIMGLRLTIEMQDGLVRNGTKCCAYILDECNGGLRERRMVVRTEGMNYIYNLLNDVNCSYVSELVGKPVEVELEGNKIKSFRILTEGDLSVDRERMQ